MKLDFSRQSFDKYPNIEFHENPFQWESSFLHGTMDGQTNGRTEGQTDRRDPDNSGFSQLANAPKNGRSLCHFIFFISPIFCCFTSKAI